MGSIQTLMSKQLILILVLVTIFVGLVASIAHAGSIFGSDPSFGNHGLVTGRLGPADLVATTSSKTLLRDEHGRIVLGAANGGEWQVRRFLSDGTLDTSFGSEGEVVITSWGGISNPGSDANLAAAALRPDGRILLVGYVGSHFVGTTRKGTAYMIMKQLMPDGSPDESFGQKDGGLVFGNLSGASSVALRPDGRFVVGGFKQLSGTGPGDDGVLIGFTSDGRSDPSFAGGGSVLIPGAGRRNSYLLDVNVLSNGGILAAGSMQDRALVIKFRASGTLDRSFGKRGRVLEDAGPRGCRCSIARSMDRDNKGRIIVAGQVNSVKLPGASYSITMRLLKDGQLDRSFGSGGIVRFYATPRAKPYATNLYDVTVDSEGGIWATGNAGLVTGKSREAVSVRYLPNGEKDRKFTLHLGDASTGWQAFRAGRNIYLSGRFNRGDSESFYLRRYKARNR